MAEQGKRYVGGTEGTAAPVPQGPQPVTGVPTAVYGSTWGLGFEGSYFTGVDGDGDVDTHAHFVEWGQSSVVIPDDSYLSNGLLAGCAINQTGLTPNSLDVNGLYISYYMNANPAFYATLNEDLSDGDIGVSCLLAAFTPDGANAFRMSCANPFPTADLNGAQLTDWTELVQDGGPMGSSYPTIGDLFSTDGTGLIVAPPTPPGDPETDDPTPGVLIIVNFTLTMFVDRD
jgi:hypothetical protein